MEAASVSGTTRIVLANFANIGPDPPIEAAATVMGWGPFGLNSGALSDATFVFWEGTGLVTADLRSYGFIVATAGTGESIQSSLSAFAVGSVLSLPYIGACIGHGFLAEASGMFHMMRGNRCRSPCPSISMNPSRWMTLPFARRSLEGVAALEEDPGDHRHRTSRGVRKRPSRPCFQCR